MKRYLPLLFALAACGDNLHLGESDAGVGVDAYPTAPHPAWPQITPHAGTVIAHPKLITITFTDDPARSNDEAFGDYIMTSDWLAQVGAEYGVGKGNSEAKIPIGTAPTNASTSSLEALVQGKITDGTLPAPPATDNSYIYMLYVPPSVVLGADLNGFYGYHQQSTVGGVKFALAIILDDGTGNDTTTTTAAHELIEAATDPYNSPDDGWYLDRPLPDPWYTIAGEVGDLCDGELLVRAGSFAVQRSWSNAAAAAGKNPCIPEDPDDSFNDVTVDPPNMPTIPAGGSATFTITGWSTDARPDWTLDTYVADYSDLDENAIAPTLSGTSINNGKTLTITLHAPASATSGQIGALYLLSRFDPNTSWAYRPWPVGFIVQ